MPRTIKDSDDHTDTRHGQRTRAPIDDSVMNSPIRRSSRLKQQVKRDGTSPPSDASLKATGRRAGTADGAITDSPRTLRSKIRRNTESLSSSSASDAVKSNARVNKRAVRAGSERKSPALSTPRGRRAASMDSVVVIEKNDGGITPPSKLIRLQSQASVPPSEPAVREESEDLKSTDYTDFDGKRDNGTSVAESRISSGSDISEAITEVSEETASNVPAQVELKVAESSLERSGEIKLTSSRDSSANLLENSYVHKSSAVEVNGENVSNKSLEEEQESSENNENENIYIYDGTPSKENIEVHGENVGSKSTEKQQRSPGNKENENINIYDGTPAKQNKRLHDVFNDSSPKPGSARKLFVIKENIQKETTPNKEHRLNEVSRVSEKINSSDITEADEKEEISVANALVTVSNVPEDDALSDKTTPLVLDVVDSRKSESEGDPSKPVDLETDMNSAETKPTKLNSNVRKSNLATDSPKIEDDQRAKESVKIHHAESSASEHDKTNPIVFFPKEQSPTKNVTSEEEYQCEPMETSDIPEATAEAPIVERVAESSPKTPDEKIMEAANAADLPVGHEKLEDTHAENVSQCPVVSEVVKTEVVPDDSDVDMDTQNLFQDCPKSSYETPTVQRNDERRISECSTIAEGQDNSCETDCDLVLVDKEAWQAAEKLKVMQPSPDLDYDTDDTVELKALADSMRETNCRSEHELSVIHEKSKQECNTLLDKSSLKERKSLNNSSNEKSLSRAGKKNFIEATSTPFKENIKTVRNSFGNVTSFEQQKKNSLHDGKDEDEEEEEEEEDSEDDEDEAGILSKSRKLDDCSKVVQMNSSSASSLDDDSDDSLWKNESRKIPKFLFAQAGDTSSDDASGERADEESSMDSDIAREYNLAGRSDIKHSDDDAPGDECRPSETESSDSEDDGEDLKDFIVDDEESDSSDTKEEDEEEVEEEEDEGEEEKGNEAKAATIEEVEEEEEEEEEKVNKVKVETIEEAEEEETEEEEEEKEEKVNKVKVETIEEAEEEETEEEETEEEETEEKEEIKVETIEDQVVPGIGSHSKTLGTKVIRYELTKLWTVEDKDKEPTDKKSLEIKSLTNNLVQKKRKRTVSDSNTVRPSKRIKNETKRTEASREIATSGKKRQRPSKKEKIDTSESGSTTEFSIVDLQKESKRRKKLAAIPPTLNPQEKNSKKSAAVHSFRQKMLARNSRQPISAYLAYLQKQKASNRNQFT